MRENKFNVKALDKNFNLLALLRPINIQWNRAYHEAGTFSVQLPINQYTPNMEYIYTDDRPEIGRIYQRNYVKTATFEYMQLSGYFLEHELNRMVVYPHGANGQISDVSWINQKGSAESVAFAYFEAFKTITFGGKTFTLPISSGTDRGRGHEADHHRNGEYLGRKIYNILKPSGMSYRINFDYMTTTEQFEVWEGLDRTQDNADGNNPIVFSTMNGSIKNPSILISDTDYKNAVVAFGTKTEDETEINITAARTIDGEDMEHFRFLSHETTMNSGDYPTTEEFVEAIINDALNEANENYESVYNVEFDAMEGSYDYMTEFDLGDLCSLEIPEMGLSADIRLIECHEVVKDGNWSLTMEFGTPIIKRRN